MIKAQKKLGKEEMFLNIIKATYNEPIANIIADEEQLKLSLLKSRARQGGLRSPFLFNITFKFLAREIRQEQEIKGIQIGKEEVKLSLLTDGIILHLKYQKTLPENYYK
jgi:hypothetical protein